MRIEGFDDRKNDPEILRVLRRTPSLEYKFILVRTIDEIVAHVFIGIRHTIVLHEFWGLDNPESFIGAGRGKGSAIEWDSSSCRAVIGLWRDRPTDSTEADQLLAEFRESMRAMLSSTAV